MASSLASGFVGTHSKKRPSTLRCRVWGGGVGGGEAGVGVEVGEARGVVVLQQQNSSMLTSLFLGKRQAWLSGLKGRLCIGLGPLAFFYLRFLGLLSRPS